MKETYTTTKTGIEIGCMYQRPLRQLNPDEEKIQIALLNKRRSEDMLVTLYKTFLSTLGVKNERT